MESKFEKQMILEQKFLTNLAKNLHRHGSNEHRRTGIVYVINCQADFLNKFILLYGDKGKK